MAVEVVGVRTIEPPPILSSPKPGLEKAEAGISYGDEAAKILATLYLTNKGRAIRYAPAIMPYEFYTLGLIEIQERVLKLIGHDHILNLDPTLTNPDKPPMREVKLVSLDDIQELAKLYDEARSVLKGTGFDSKPDNKITPAEARVRGNMVELAKSLIQFGQSETIREIDDRYQPRRKFLDTSRQLH